MHGLLADGFQIDFRSHAKAILSGDFPDVAVELEEVLLSSTVPIQEIIGSGGGETKGTQRLRNALAAKGWRKHNFIVKRTIDGVEKEAPPQWIKGGNWPPHRMLQTSRYDVFFLAF